MKTTLIRIVFTLVFLVVFNTLFFLLSGTDNPTSVWVSYAYIHVAYFTILFLPVLKTKGDASYYLSSVLYGQAITYFILELIAGVVFIIYRMESPVWSLVVQTALWLIFVVLILGNAWANQATAQSLEKRKQDIDAYQSMRMSLKRLMAKTDKPELKRLIADCSDKLEASSSRQTQESEKIDIEIEQAIASLRQSITGDDVEESTSLARQLAGLIEERKTILKYSH
ncbi:hypothetical protein HMPREF1212_00976 [Parabacteroides sp. HGS0025]|uniref:hypothetical protein n=1 Tax=Parabacteroides sp. HGS0025 TaxID=1078087 RepID=UPI0006170CA1|nr:hypothetical protein [Parabacteroides sp. HGS0025]KKB52819.1 hypothetical protein HMPREF1212_00976 [Parabacteroides sp. HGS0025]